MTWRLRYPVRRLVITGEDGPKNFAILLGPHWACCVADVHKLVRIQVFLCPPLGSLAHTMACRLDAGSPRWTPRWPTSEELVEVEKIRDMEKLVADMT